MDPSRSYSEWESYLTADDCLKQLSEKDLIELGEAKSKTSWLLRITNAFSSRQARVNRGKRVLESIRWSFLEGKGYIGTSSSNDKWFHKVNDALSPEEKQFLLKPSFSSGRNPLLEDLIETEQLASKIANLLNLDTEVVIEKTAEHFLTDKEPGTSNHEKRQQIAGHLRSVLRASEILRSSADTDLDVSITDLLAFTESVEKYCRQFEGSRKHQDEAIKKTIQNETSIQTKIGLLLEAAEIKQTQDLTSKVNKEFGHIVKKKMTKFIAPNRGNIGGWNEGIDWLAERKKGWPNLEFDRLLAVCIDSVVEKNGTCDLSLSEDRKALGIAIVQLHLEEVATRDIATLHREACWKYYVNLRVQQATSQEGNNTAELEKRIKQSKPSPEVRKRIEADKKVIAQERRKANKELFGLSKEQVRLRLGKEIVRSSLDDFLGKTANLQTQRDDLLYTFFLDPSSNQRRPEVAAEKPEALIRSVHAHRYSSSWQKEVQSRYKHTAERVLPLIQQDYLCFDPVASSRARRGFHRLVEITSQVHEGDKYSKEVIASATVKCLEQIAFGSIGCNAMIKFDEATARNTGGPRRIDLFRRACKQEFIRQEIDNTIQSLPTDKREKLSATKAKLFEEHLQGLFSNQRSLSEKERAYIGAYTRSFIPYLIDYDFATVEHTFADYQSKWNIADLRKPHSELPHFDRDKDYIDEILEKAHFTQKNTIRADQLLNALEESPMRFVHVARELLAPAKLQSSQKELETLLNAIENALNQSEGSERIRAKIRKISRDPYSAAAIQLTNKVHLNANDLYKALIGIAFEPIKSGLDDTLSQIKETDRLESIELWRQALLADDSNADPRIVKNLIIPFLQALMQKRIDELVKIEDKAFEKVSHLNIPNLEGHFEEIQKLQKTLNKVTAEEKGKEAINLAVGRVETAKKRLDKAISDSTDRRVYKYREARKNTKAMKARLDLGEDEKIPEIGKALVTALATLSSNSHKLRFARTFQFATSMAANQLAKKFAKPIFKSIAGSQKDPKNQEIAKHLTEHHSSDLIKVGLQLFTGFMDKLGESDLADAMELAHATKDSTKNPNHPERNDAEILESLLPLLKTLVEEIESYALSIDGLDLIKAIEKK